LLRFAFESLGDVLVLGSGVLRVGLGVVGEHRPAAPGALARAAFEAAAPEAELLARVRRLSERSSAGPPGKE
jgi:hypothetical protein